MIRSRKIEKFAFRGLHGCASHCDLEIIPLRDGRTVVIAIEREDNFGTSVTNAAEYLASYVCDQFEIDPDQLVWIEHYAYAGRARCKREYDRVTFTRREPERIAWSPAILAADPMGWHGHFEEPDWRPMTKSDWLELGVEPRS